MEHILLKSETYFTEYNGTDKRFDDKWFLPEDISGASSYKRWMGQRNISLMERTDGVL
ncbi:MAG: hypothetical protein IPG70_08670 [Moraxellaceae bacterium]|nr:hypothetical protein [Moraxellaceae bacterium]